MACVKAYKPAFHLRQDQPPNIDYLPFVLRTHHMSNTHYGGYALGPGRELSSFLIQSRTRSLISTPQVLPWTH
uniref:Uncharacterized protein n=1 Tax=Picea glauca TaxID=3330 RepID=A0A101M251_PICGL|nr:hypothetical protein ABT39_MTgene2737 [Picea glauca]QHR90515.1 hypothetical protein Q903MT_gene4540 [Picea sitchensis]